MTSIHWAILFWCLSEVGLIMSFLGPSIRMVWDNAWLRFIYSFIFMGMWLVFFVSGMMYFDDFRILHWLMGAK